MSKMATMVAIFKIFKPHLLLKGKLNWAEVDGRHWGDMETELLNWARIELMGVLFTQCSFFFNGDMEIQTF